MEWIKWPGTLTLNGISIVSKKSIAESFNIFLSILTRTLHPKTNYQNIHAANTKKENHKFIFSEPCTRICDWKTHK